MATELSSIKGVSITRYARGNGKGHGYQVTWQDDEFRYQRYVSFATLQEAQAFQGLLALSIDRG